MENGILYNNHQKNILHDFMRTPILNTIKYLTPLSSCMQLLDDFDQSKLVTIPNVKNLSRYMYISSTT